MNGAESLVRTLVASGVQVCFGNPGTSEMHFLAALERVEGMRAILGLFEGVVTGAADGYGRMADKPAATLLHLGPGFGNGIANLHNARRAGSPIVNIVGDHATYHARFDAPLTSDVQGMARPVSHWLHASTSALGLAADGARAVQAARQTPGQIATLILPADCAWDEAAGPAPALPINQPAPVEDAAVARARAALTSGKPAAILLGGAALREPGLTLAGRIAKATGATLLCDTFTPRLRRGAGHVPVMRIPYFAEQIVATMKAFGEVILVGTKPPVAFFAYPGKPSEGLDPATHVTVLSHQHEDGLSALAALAESLGAKDEGERAGLSLPDAPNGELDVWKVGAIIARHLPENAVLSDEGATGSLQTQIPTANARPHDVLSLTGGSIGQGIPVATGAAVACPERKVVCLQGDGGALYTIQALWTQAREGLDVVTVILANRSYAILNIELARVDAGNPGPRTLDMLRLSRPDLDFVALARGFGVEASRATTAKDFEDQFKDAMARQGPRLIEAIV